MLSKVYINLIDQREPTLNFQNQDHQKRDEYFKNVSYYKKIVLPTNDEIKKHQEYLKKNLKTNFLNQDIPYLELHIELFFLKFFYL